MPTDQIIGLKEFSSVLFQIVMAAFIVERGLALLFEWDAWDYLVEKAPWLEGGKEVIAFAASYTICLTVKFDALRILFKSDLTDTGQVITAMVIAGGSKGAIKLMQDVWKIGNVPQETGGTQDATSKVNAAIPGITSPQSSSASRPTGTREGKI